MSGLPPSPSGFEMVVRPAFVLREPVRDSAVISTLKPLSGGIWRAFAETFKLGHVSQLSVAAKEP